MQKNDGRPFTRDGVVHLNAVERNTGCWIDEFSKSLETQTYCSRYVVTLLNPSALRSQVVCYSCAQAIVASIETACSERSQASDKNRSGTTRDLLALSRRLEQCELSSRDN